MAHNTYPLWGGVSTAVTGRYLAHNGHDRVARAFMAADLFTGRTHLVKPTFVQVGALARVNRTYAGWAVKRLAERCAIEAGHLPLVPPVPQVNGTTLPVSITAAAIADSEVIDFVRYVGVARVIEAACAVEAAQ
jgi:hypothetical protein